MAATVGAANLTLTYLLFTAEHLGISIAAYVPFMAIGSAPCLLTAGLLALGARGGADDASRKSNRLCVEGIHSRGARR